MSRTDKTKPWWVRASEHHPRPEHDHSNGICDLPDSALAQHHNVQWTRTQCHWDDHHIIYGDCCTGCGCPQCRDQYGHRRSIRSERHTAKQALQAIRTGVEDDDTPRLSGTRRAYWTIRSRYEIPMCDAGRRLHLHGQLWNDVCTQVGLHRVMQEHLDEPWRLCERHRDAYHRDAGNSQT